MSAMDELFAAAKRAGVGVLVINELHIGDVITADQIVSGDYNDSHNVTTTLTVPREALSLAARSRGVAFGDSKACAPLADELQGGPMWEWRNELFDKSRKAYVDSLHSAGKDVTG